MLHRLARVWPARTGRWVLVLMAACSLGLAGNASAQPAAQTGKVEIGICIAPGIGPDIVPCVAVDNVAEVFSDDEIANIVDADPTLTGLVNREDCTNQICDPSLECGDTVKSLLVLENGGDATASAFFVVQAWDVMNQGLPNEWISPGGPLGGTDVLPADLPAGCDSSNPTSLAACQAIDHLPIISVEGNTDCAIGGGLPCVVCPAGQPAVDNAGCNGNFLPGRIIFYSDEYVLQESDVPNSPVGNIAGTTRYAQCDESGTCNTDNAAVLEDVGERPVSCDPDEVTLQNYKCYSAKPEPGTGFDQKEVVLTDQFTGETVATVITPFEICNPVRKEGLEDDTDEALNGPGEPHLMCYKLLAPDTIGPDVLARLTDQFGSLTHRIGDSVVLCQPALKSCFARAVEDLIDEGVDLDEAEGIARLLCEEAYVGLDAKLAHLNCYQSFEQDEQPFGQCSDTVQVCDVDADCPGFEPTGGGETCVELSPPVPHATPLLIELTDQWGTTLSAMDETSLHCNPLTQKVVDGDDPENFVPPLFPADTEFDVPDGVNIAEEEVHYRCYLIEDDGPPDALEDDPRTRRILVEDQFGTNPIRVGIGTRLCEPAVKELLQEKPQTRAACGLLGIEALLGLVPLALLRRRKERRH
jgi:hypothetical protein